MLVKAIRECADSNSTIGKNLLSVVVPKRAVEEEATIAVTGSPLSSTITFQCWPEGCWDGILWGPNVASAGSSATNFQAGALEPMGETRLGGITVEASGTKTIHYPCCAVRKRGAQVLLSHPSAAGNCVVIFTETKLLDRILEQNKDAEPILFDTAAELHHFLDQVRSDFDGVFFNPGGSDERSGSLNLVRVIEILNN